MHDRVPSWNISPASRLRRYAFSEYHSHANIARVGSSDNDHPGPERTEVRTKKNPLADTSGFHRKVVDLHPDSSNYSPPPRGVKQHEQKSSRPIWLGADERGWDHARIHKQLICDDRLGAIEIAVYTALAIHAETQSGVCFPALDTIGRYVKAHPRTVRRSLQVLRDAGWISIKEERGRASTYTLLPPPPISPPRTESAGVLIPTPDTDRAHPGQKVQGTPDTDRDEREPRTRSNNEADQNYFPGCGRGDTATQRAAAVQAGRACHPCDGTGIVEDGGFASQCYTCHGSGIGPLVAK